jgi:2-oxoglutarate dehydrogenase E2 component (dihydrolipoamide succinyltransferase)
MMMNKVIMPALMSNHFGARVIQWLKNEGDPVEEWEALLEVEVSGQRKVIHSLMKGEIKQILVKEGDIANQDETLAVISEAEESTDIKQGPLQTPIIPSGRRVEKSCASSSPALEYLLEEFELDDESSEFNADYAIIDGDEMPAPAPQDSSMVMGEDFFRSELDHEIDALPIASLSITTDQVIPAETSSCPTIFMQADLSRIESHRKAAAEKGEKYSYSVYFAHAVSRALTLHTAVLSTWVPEGLITYTDICIGFEIFQEKTGLVIPAFYGLERLSLEGLSRVIQALVKSRQQNSLLPVPIKPGTFIISNHGVRGPFWGTPVIHNGQSGGLSIGAIQSQVISWNGEAVVHPMVGLSLSYDVRALRPLAADRFLEEIVNRLENWG